MTPGDRIPTDGGAPLGQNPFAGLRGDGLPAVPEQQRTEVQRTENRGQGVGKPKEQKPGTEAQATGDRRQGSPNAEMRAQPSTPNTKPKTQNSPATPAAPHNRGRVDIKRTTAGRGGKTVTEVSGFVGIGAPEKEQLAKKIQKACGAGGTVKDGCIEIQGDQRATAARILAEAGFRPVFAGG